MFALVTSGVASLLSCPLERAKLLQQLSVVDPQLGHRSAVLSLWADEGFLALFRGHLTRAIRPVAVAVAAPVAVRAQPGVMGIMGRGGFSPMAQRIVSGCVKGAIVLLLTYPLDLMYTIRACQRTSSKGSIAIKSYSEVARYIIKQHGIRGLYAGFTVSVVGVFVYRCLYFGLYDLIQKLFPTNHNVILSFVKGYGITLLAGYVSYPLDTIRRVQMLSSFVSPTTPTPWAALQLVVQKGGVRALWRGAGKNVQRCLLGALIITAFSAWAPRRRQARRGGARNDADVAERNRQRR